MSLRACLAGTGLQRSDIASPGLTVVGSQELTVIRNLVAFAGDEPGLGTRCGVRFTLGRLGIYGFAIRMSPTVRDLVAVAIRQGYGKFAWNLITPVLEEGGSGSQLAVLDEFSVPEDVRPFLIERDLAFIVTVVNRASGGRTPLTVTTTLPAYRVAPIRPLLPMASIESGRPRNTVRFSRDVLDRHLPGGDEYAVRLCEQQCEDLLERRSAHDVPGNVTACVESVLLRLPPRRWTLTDVARERGIHTRTLNRQLAAEGATFRDIADSLRSTLATRMLSTTELSVSQVARRLGYTETASFVRAYKRWTGRTPGATARASSRSAPPERAAPVVMSP
jgi:AraC-like DNA-binding protein